MSLNLPASSPITVPSHDIENQQILSPNEVTASVPEDQPLLGGPELESWAPPPTFLWIQVTIMANVFLYGFDTTITAATYAVISSAFDAANAASWLTTSYIVTSTAFQLLYVRFTDIFGCSVCFFVSSVTFSLVCLGCGFATNIVLLNCI